MYVSLKLAVNEIHVVIIIITSSLLHVYMLPCALAQFSKQLSNCRNML